jgi:hypothetical protein
VRRLLLVPLVLVALVACGTPAPTATPTFRRYTADEVTKALAPLGITDVRHTPRGPDVQSPNTATDQRDFAIPSIAPKGGQLLLFGSPADVAGMRAWYARFPDLAPYVYVNGNALLQLNSTLPKAEAEKFRAALEAMR